MPDQAAKTPRFFRPTVDTPFHIDHDWWERNQSEMRVYLLSHLCAMHREMYAESPDTKLMDWVDPNTAEVKAVDGLVFQLQRHCSQQPDYITANTSVVDAVFRVFLANANQPLTPRQLAERIGKSETLILKALTGRTVYKGLRPLAE